MRLAFVRGRGDLRSGDALLVHQRHADDARRRFGLQGRMALFDFPARCLMATRSAQQGDASLFEVHQRIVSVEATHELPELQCSSGQQAVGLIDGGFESVCGIGVSVPYDVGEDVTGSKCSTSRR